MEDDEDDASMVVTVGGMTSGGNLCIGPSSSSNRAASRKSRVYVFRQFVMDKYRHYITETLLKRRQLQQRTTDDSSNNNNNHHRDESSSDSSKFYVLDVAGGNGDLSWLLNNVHEMSTSSTSSNDPNLRNPNLLPLNIHSTVIDPRGRTINCRHMIKSITWLEQNPVECRQRSISGLPTHQPLASLIQEGKIVRRRRRRRGRTDDDTNDHDNHDNDESSSDFDIPQQIPLALNDEFVQIIQRLMSIIQSKMATTTTTTTINESRDQCNDEISLRSVVSDPLSLLSEEELQGWRTFYHTQQHQNHKQQQETKKQSNRKRLTRSERNKKKRAMRMMNYRTHKHHRQQLNSNNNNDNNDDATKEGNDEELTNNIDINNNVHNSDNNVHDNERISSNGDNNECNNNDVETNENGVKTGSVKAEEDNDDTNNRDHVDSVGNNDNTDDDKDDDVSADEALRIILKTDLICGFHPDQATDSCIDLATVLNVPFCIVPCCVFPSEFPNRRLIKTSSSNKMDTVDAPKQLTKSDVPQQQEMTTTNTTNTNRNGSNETVQGRKNSVVEEEKQEEQERVRTYSQLIEYLQQKCPTAKKEYLRFVFTETAKNIVLYTTTTTTAT